MSGASGCASNTCAALVAATQVGRWHAHEGCDSPARGYVGDVELLALACPRCSTTDAVRAAVFGDAFWPTLAVLLLPLAIIGAIAAGLYRLGRRRTESER